MRLARTMSAMAITAAALAAPAIAQTSTIEGVWTQAAPSTVLTPADGKPVPFTKAGKRAWQANRAAAAKGGKDAREKEQAG